MSLGAPKLLVIGDVMNDIIVRPDGPVAHGADRSARIENRPGGSAANTACWLAIEGVRTVFAGRVGRADCEHHARLLTQFGVDPALAVDDSLPTGSTITLLSPGGERSFLTDRGANDELCEADLPDALLAGVALIHISGYALFSERPRAAVLRLLVAARKQGIPCSIDAASHSRLAEVGAARFLGWIEGVEWLFANQAEATVLTGSTSVQDQLADLSQRAGAVVIKLGADGAALREHGVQLLQPAAPHVEVVDTTGAGDALIAGFLAAHLREESTETCLHQAVTLGSLAVTMLGGRPQVPEGYVHVLFPRVGSAGESRTAALAATEASQERPRGR